MEYSLVIASVISIGHISTTALAAATLGSMTASVTGFSIIQGFTSALDTMLPSAWTSSQPNLVGLWSQRIGKFMYPFRTQRKPTSEQPQSLCSGGNVHYANCEKLYLSNVLSKLTPYFREAHIRHLVQRGSNPARSQAGSRSCASRLHLFKMDSHWSSSLRI